MEQFPNAQGLKVSFEEFIDLTYFSYGSSDGFDKERYGTKNPGFIG